MEKIPLIVVAGPTASGKTDLSIELAKRHNGEVICADSMQIYSGISIGTARPTENEMCGINHRMFGFLPVECEYSVAQYVNQAKKEIAEVTNAGNVPILCGGTGLYITSLVDNIEFTEAEKDEELRAKLTARGEEYGFDKLLEELKKLDPLTAERLHENDHKRIVRALEVYYSTGITVTEQNNNSKKSASPYDACIIAIDFRERQKLYDRINLRVEKMLAGGVLDEAECLLKNESVGTIAQAIGYKEFYPFFKGECTLEGAVEMLKRDTRRLAKRQLTWLRRDKRVRWIYFDDFSSFDLMTQYADEIIREWRKHDEHCPSDEKEYS